MDPEDRYSRGISDGGVDHTTRGRTLYENMLDSTDVKHTRSVRQRGRGRLRGVTTDQPYGKNYIELKIVRGGSDDDKHKDAFRSDRFLDEFKQYLRGLYLVDSPKDIGETRLDAVINYLTDFGKKFVSKERYKRLLSIFHIVDGHVQTNSRIGHTILDIGDLFRQKYWVHPDMDKKNFENVLKEKENIPYFCISEDRIGILYLGIPNIDGKPKIFEVTKETVGMSNKGELKVTWPGDVYPTYYRNIIKLIKDVVHYYKSEGVKSALHQRDGIMTGRGADRSIYGYRDYTKVI
jgi:hypothetical protein